jgi:hypothetical protein
MNEPTPPPWTFDGHAVTGPKQFHPHDPQGLVYAPATIVAILPANYGGAFSYYPPEERDANGRLIQAAHDMLQAVREFARADANPSLDLAQVAERARALLARHGFALDPALPTESTDATVR